MRNHHNPTTASGFFRLNHKPSASGRPSNLGMKHKLGVSKGATIQKKHCRFTRTSRSRTLLPAQHERENPFAYIVLRVSTPNEDFVRHLLVEFPNEQFWHDSEKTKLQCVPTRFRSIQEYVGVLDPLLLEECRAQLCSTWMELTDTCSKNVYAVRIKEAKRRNKGWYDVILLIEHGRRSTCKDGDVAVLTFGNRGSAGSNSNHTCANAVYERTVGLVKKPIEFDTRDLADKPEKLVFCFYVGDAFDLPDSEVEDDPILKMLQLRGLRYLTVLGSPITSVWEHLALKGFESINSQMQNVILKPKSSDFPNFEEEPPNFPQCLTHKFLSYLRRNFNGPQCSAIQWAAMHTSPRPINMMIERQNAWPFTLIQGPPGTGKTHTVWGMLNVLHLVLSQHYHAALLKEIELETFKELNDGSSESFGSVSIDQIFQSANLIHMVPKPVILTRTPSIAATSGSTGPVLDGMKCIQKLPKPRILVCAPSNAATDELLTRVISRGFVDGDMKAYQPSVARVGISSLTFAAQNVSVEHRTQLYLRKRNSINLLEHDLEDLETRETQLADQIIHLQNELKDAGAACDCKMHDAQDEKYVTLLERLAEVVKEQYEVQVEISRLMILVKEPRKKFNLEAARADIEASFFDEADIVFTTVSSCGRNLFSRIRPSKHEFNKVIIDEAAQACEVSVLSPLTRGAAHCVLVGDPQQLPATVISKVAENMLYGRSLFERFHQVGIPAMLLSVQYRMHPQIRDFPSGYFYQGRLTDSKSVSTLPDELYYKNPLLKPYIFYDITHGLESHGSGSVSYQNLHEAKLCRRIYNILQATLKSAGASKVSVGIITPYKLQMKCLQSEFEDVLKSEMGKGLYINTVDAFQGQERDVIIMSCVRASSRGVGFVADIRRMNVALTRARRALWVMGKAKALMQSEDWAALITDAKSRKCFLSMDSSQEGYKFEE